MGLYDPDYPRGHQITEADYLEELGMDPEAQKCWSCGEWRKCETSPDGPECASCTLIGEQVLAEEMAALGMERAA